MWVKSGTCPKPKSGNDVWDRRLERTTILDKLKPKSQNKHDKKIWRN